MACTHEINGNPTWHLVELESINESYIDKDVAFSRTRENRSAIFICELCGELKKVLVI